LIPIENQIVANQLTLAKAPGSLLLTRPLKGTGNKSRFYAFSLPSVLTDG